MKKTKKGRSFKFNKYPSQGSHCLTSCARRAYIAASRRSDRSLEARIESARRASEIHKKRTGRALRVTEQDVVNEEMYSEEDDDYPNVYRGLTRGLAAGNNEWNRRLNAYLVNQVAVRSALHFDPAFMQYNRGGGAYPPNTMYPPGFMTQNPQMMQHPQMMSHQQLMQQPLMHTPQMMHSQGVPSPQIQTTHASLRQQPYPSPNGGQRLYARQMQMHVPQGIQMPQYQQEGAGIRRSSIAAPPAASPASTSSTTRRMSSPPTNSTNQMNSTQLVSPQATPQPPQSRVLQPTFEQTASPESVHTPYMPHNDFFEFPLTTELPPESQQFLHSSLDPNDALYSSLMNGYTNPTFMFNPSATGLKTLAPDASSNYSTYDFNDLCGINQYSLCGSSDVDVPYCSPDPSSSQMMPSPLKSSPVSPLGTDDGLGLADGPWYQYINTEDVAK